MSRGSQGTNPELPAGSSGWVFVDSVFAVVSLWTWLNSEDGLFVYPFPSVCVCTRGKIYEFMAVLAILNISPGYFLIFSFSMLVSSFSKVET